MSKYTKSVLKLVALLLTFYFTANAQLPTGKLSIGFNHFAGSERLVLDSNMYKNELGQYFSIGNLKYYISGICLEKESGKRYASNEFFLINEDDAQSKKISLADIPVGTYTGIHFILGVDSTHNCSGAQSGALDPVNTMFWAWNTGYIFLKIEGKSPSSSAPGKIIEYHIGGYKQSENSIRTIHLPFSTALKIDASATSTIEIKADILELFKSPATIDFSKLPSVTDPKKAKIIADNYIDMFCILSIK